MEETHHGIIGRKIPASSLEELMKSMESLGNSVSIGCRLLNEEWQYTGTIVKYGLLDLTLERTDVDGYIKIYAIAENCGLRYIQKTDPNFTSDRYIEYFHKYNANPQVFFPLVFEIIDCYKTDDQYIWSEKYLYI